MTMNLIPAEPGWTVARVQDDKLLGVYPVIGWTPVDDYDVRPVVFTGEAAQPLYCLEMTDRAAGVVYHVMKPGQHWSHVPSFIRERCTVEDGAEVNAPTLYHYWDEWCREKALDPGSEKRFHADVRACVPRARLSRMNVWSGLRLGRRS